MNWRNTPMLIMANHAGDWFNSGTGNNSGYFREHSQRMKEFRLAHPKNWRQWRCEECEAQENPLALPEMTLVYELEQCRHSPN